MDNNDTKYNSNDNDNKIVFYDPVEEYTLIPKTPEQKDMYKLAEEAIIESGVTDYRLTIYFYDTPNEKFLDFQKHDPGHLSFGTTINLDTIFVCTEYMKFFASHDTSNFVKFRNNNNINVTNSEDYKKAELKYIQMILVEEIKRFVGDRHH